MAPRDGEKAGGLPVPVGAASRRARTARSRVIASAQSASISIGPASHGLILASHPFELTIAVDMLPATKTFPSLSVVIP